MNKPNALVKLLAELAAESVGTSVVTVKNSYATVGFSGEPEGLQLTPADCELIFDTPETVTQFFEALDEPADAALELHNISLEDEVMDMLHEYFSVDES